MLTVIERRQIAEHPLVFSEVKSFNLSPCCIYFESCSWQRHKHTQNNVSVFLLVSGL